MTDDRIVTTGKLLDLIEEAEEYEFNRQIVKAAVEEELDPFGLHVVTPVLMYHQPGIPPEPFAQAWPEHHRCSVLVKVRDSDEPVKLMLDVTVKSFESLPTPEMVSKITRELRQA